LKHYSAQLIITEITIDGDTNVSFTENVEARFKSYGWNVLHVEKGDDDFAAIEAAIAEAKKVTDAPTIINLKTTIGFGSLKAGGHDVHGARKYIIALYNSPD
jgi:transketolase